MIVLAIIYFIISAIILTLGTFAIQKGYKVPQAELLLVTLLWPVLLLYALLFWDKVNKDL